MVLDWEVCGCGLRGQWLRSASLGFHGTVTGTANTYILRSKLHKRYGEAGDEAGQDEPDQVRDLQVGRVARCLRVQATSGWLACQHNRHMHA